MAEFEVGQTVYVSDHNNTYASASGDVTAVFRPRHEDDPILYKVAGIKQAFRGEQLTTDYVHNPWGGPCYNPAPVCHCGRERA